MTRRFPRTILLVTIGMLVAFLTVSIMDDGDEAVPVSGESVGGAEFSSERVRWEWMRLRDPATNKIPDGIRQRELRYARTLPAATPAFYKSAGLPPHVWNSRGPYNIGGRTRALAVDITGEDTIIAGGVSSGIWRSTDGGAVWNRMTAPDELPSVTTIVQDTRPGKNHIWYYGSGEMIGNSAGNDFIGGFFTGDGIFKSTDNGRTWFSLESSASGTPQTADRQDNIWRLALDPSNMDEDVVYAATPGYLLRSVDGGESWDQVMKPSNPLRRSVFSDIAVTPSGVVYATMSADGNPRGMFRSEDGENFTRIMPPDLSPYFTHNRIAIGLVPSSENVVYFFAETPGFGSEGKNFRGWSSWHSLWKYTYVSGDGSGEGGVWEDRSGNLPQLADTVGMFGDLDSQGSYDLVVRVKPDDEDVVIIGGTNLYRSTDGFASQEGTSWIGGYSSVGLDSMALQLYEYPGHHPDQHDVVFSYTDPNVMYTGSDGGVHKTVDCLADSVRWISLNTGYLTSQFYTLTIDHATPGDYSIMGGLQDNGTWRTGVTDPSAPWIQIGSADGAFCAIAEGGKFLYTSKQLGRIYRTDLDENGKATGSTRIDPQGGTGYLFINPLILDPVDNNVMYLSENGYIWKNDSIAQIPRDNITKTSIGWERLEQSLVPGIPFSIMSCLQASTKGPSHRLYYGGFNGYVFRMDNVHERDPFGVNITSPDFPDRAYTSCIAVDPEDGDRAIVVFSNYNVKSLFMTTNSGETWESIGGNLEENADGSGAGPSCRWAAYVHRPGGTVYLVATSTGLYSTTSLNGDNTVWTLEAPNTIGNMVVNMINVRQSDGFVAVATHGLGIFSTVIGTVGVEERTEFAGLELGQNYPNPVRTSTMIPFTIPGTASVPVEIMLYNTEGKEITTIYRERVGPGKHEIRFDPDRGAHGALPSGTYFYSLKTGENIQFNSMNIVR